MTTLDLARLRAVAEAATRGPWHSHKENGFEHENEIAFSFFAHRIGETYARAHDYGKQAVADAAHIAAFNPAVALALIERLERYEKALRFIDNGCLVPPDGGTPTLSDALKAAHEALATEGGTRDEHD